MTDLDKQCARAIEFDDYLDRRHEQQKKEAPAVEPEPEPGRQAELHEVPKSPVESMRQPPSTCKPHVLQ